MFLIAFAVRCCITNYPQTEQLQTIKIHYFSRSHGLAGLSWAVLPLCIVLVEVTHVAALAGSLAGAETSKMASLTCLAPQLGSLEEQGANLGLSLSTQTLVNQHSGLSLFIYGG